LKGRKKPDLSLAVSENAGAAEEMWILDSGSSRHLVNNEDWLDDVELCADSSVQPNGDPLHITKKGTLTLNVTARGREQTIKLSDVYFAREVKHNLISYGVLNKKGYKLDESGEQRVMAAKGGGPVAFDVDLQRNVLMVHASVVSRDESTAEVIMAALESEANGTTETPEDVQSSSSPCEIEVVEERANRAGAAITATLELDSQGGAAIARSEPRCSRAPGRYRPTRRWGTHRCWPHAPPFGGFAEGLPRTPRESRCGGLAAAP
jgi:hypothetical protein